jgi:hypothetical protein
MKKIFALLSVVSLSILFMGCPYSSDVPIDKPSVKMDAAIIGVWGPDSKTDSTTYTISKIDDMTFLIKKESTTGAETTITKYKGYYSEVSGAKFMNIWTDDGSTPKYYLYKVEWADNNNTLEMSEVTDNIQETFTTSEDCKKFIQQYMGLSFFFNKDKVKYIRKS